MKKILPTEAISNELEGASLFFTKPAAPAGISLATSEPAVSSAVAPPHSPTPIPATASDPPQPIQENQNQDRTSAPSDVRTNERTYGRTVSSPKRQKIRHAFDIYRDQLMALQLRQLEAVQRGRRKPKLGKMVQEAIDLYLKRHHNMKSLG